MPFSFRRGGSPKRLPWFALIPQNAPAPVLAAERHYLQFDGVGDYAVADAVFGGISGDYTIAIKVAGRNTSGTTRIYYAAGGAGSNATRQSSYDYCYTTSGSPNNTVWASSVPASGLPNYLITGTNYPADGSARVFACKIVQSSQDTFISVVKASGAEYTTSDLFTTYTKPDHLGVGARVTDALTAVASTYGNVSLVGLVLASVKVPDAELTAWLNDTTAVGNITGIDHYWCASDISGASIPARVGTVALALSGPTSSDLVVWSP